MSVKTGSHKDLVEFKKRACSLNVLDEKYKPPASTDLRDLLTIMGWSYGDVAKLVGVSMTSKGSSATVQRWCSPESSSDYRKIPYSAWRLLLSYSNVRVANKIEAEELLK